MNDIVIKEAERIFGTNKGKDNKRNQCAPAGYDGFILGADFAEKQNATEIAELVAALKRLNGVCRDNFGIGDPQVSELLKKYEK